MTGLPVWFRGFIDAERLFRDLVPSDSALANVANLFERHGRSRIRDDNGRNWTLRMNAAHAHDWRDHPRLPELGLLLASFVWGATFLGTKVMMDNAGPLFFVGVRFSVAAIVLSVLFRDSLRNIGRTEFAAMFAVGVPMAIAYVLQAKGLENIQSSKSAFITAMHVPVVPILQLVFMRLAPHRMTWIGVALCLTGLVLLADPATLALSSQSGELVTLVSTLAIAFEIVMIGIFATRVDVRAVSILQLAFVAGVAFLLMPILGEAAPDPIPALFWQVTLTMGLASALIQLLMNWAQRTVSPTRATLIYSSEPVWAGIIGWIAGDRLGLLGIIGCGVILTGVLVSEWRPRSPESRVSTDSGFA